MTNRVEIRVTVNGDLVGSELSKIEGQAKNSANRQSSIWNDLNNKVGNVFKGIGGVAAGALGIGLSGPLAGAGAAVLAFGAIAAPTFSKVEKALTSTGTAGATALAALDPAQKGLYNNVKQLETSFDGLATKMEPVVTQILGMATHTAGDLLPALDKMATTGSTIVMDFLTPMNKLLESPFFANFLDQMSQLGSQIAPVVGQSLTKLLVVFMQMFLQAGPAAVQILNQLLPALVDIVGSLVPVVAGVTKLVAVTINWLAQNHLLIPALGLLGAAIIAVTATMDTNPILLMITGLVLFEGAIAHVWQTSQTFRNVVTTVFADVGKVVLTFAELWLDEMHVVSNIFLDVVGIIIHGAADAFGWVPGVGGKLKEAARAFDGFKDDVNNVFNSAHAKIEGWKTDLNNMPKKVALQGDISDLTTKLNSAKAQLKDPNLTATRRAQIQANIAQLQSQIQYAKDLLNFINGKTVTTYIQTVYNPPKTGGLKYMAHGGIVGAAGGGPRSNLVEVGEHGRELVNLPPGSTVHSNPDTERMLAEGGGGLHITLELGPSFQRLGLSTAQLEDLRYTIRQKGGKGADSVQRALGQN